ncbi:reverse transcriptase family protein [Pseudomonas wayambapalatensis]|nr:reverse transcriptase family protein [Pseudomonas wayambapalatensis]
MIKDKAHRIFKASTSSISSLESLASALDLQVDDFERVWAKEESSRYTRKEIPKSGGGVRVVFNPCVEVRKIQRRVNTRIFSNPHVVKWPGYLYGSIPKSLNSEDELASRDYISCAKQHCEAKSLLKMDIKNFFDNVHDDLVYGVFKDVLKYPEVVSNVLTRICTYRSSLVQGALTSSYLAMLSLYKEENDVVSKLKRKGLVYTRFVDDISISSKVSGYDFSYARSLVEKMLLNAGLPLNSNKTKVLYATATPLTLHGLRICFKDPRLPPEEVRRIRAAVKEIEIVAGESNYRNTYAYRRNFNRCLGRVNKLSRVKHKQHSNLVRRLSKVLPLPSQKEVNYVQHALVKLEGLFQSRGDTYWYRKHFYQLGDRLNLVARSYPRLAEEIRRRLREVKPTYE